MKQKGVLVLTVLTLVAVAVAFLLRRGQDASASSASTLLFPALEERENDVAEIHVEKNGKSATIKKEGGQWKLVDRGGYVAKFDPIKQLVVRLSSLEIEEQKTAKKENHARLALQWPPAAEGAEEGSEAGDAALVSLKDAGGKELAALVVGKSEWRGSKPKLYVRRANEDQVYLVTGPLDVVPDPKTWIEAQFLPKLENERVQSVTIEHADGERVEIARSAVDHTRFALENVPPGEKEQFEGVANGPAQALGSGLTLQDVRPAAEVDFTQSPVAHTRYRCVDGLELLVETAKFEDQTWVKVTASYVPPPSTAEEPQGETTAGDAPATEPEGEATAADAPATEPAAAEAEKKDVGKEAADLNARLAPWAFAVDSYRSDVIARRMKDLLTKPEESAEDLPEDEGFEMPFGDEDLVPAPPADDEGEAVDPAPAPETPAEDDETKPE